MNTKLPRERESKVQRSIVVRLGRLGIRLFRRNVGAMRERERFVRFGRAGEADLWGVDLHGRHWEIETKAAGRKPTEKQLAWLKEISELGCICYWSDNANDCEYVAEAVLQGGKVVWLDGCEYMIQMP